MERRPDRRTAGDGVLQLDDCQRQAVDEDHHVRAALAVIFHHRELMHGEEVVLLRLIIIENPRRVAADGTVRPLVLNGHPLDEVLVNDAVVGNQ